MNWLYRLWNLFYRNPYCYQPQYCRNHVPDDYARPGKCQDCRAEMVGRRYGP